MDQAQSDGRGEPSPKYKVGANTIAVGAPISSLWLSAKERGALAVLGVITVDDFLRLNPRKIRNLRYIHEYRHGGFLFQLASIQKQLIGEVTRDQHRLDKKSVPDARNAPPIGGPARRPYRPMRRRRPVSNGAHSSDDPFLGLRLSARGRKALALLGVKSIADLLSLNATRVLNLGGYGLSTLRNLTLAQEQLRSALVGERHEQVRQGTHASARAGPVMALDEAVMMLGVRARHVLERLRVESVESLLAVRQEDALHLRGCGRATWVQIDNLQRALGQVGEGHEQVRQGTHASALARPVMAFDEGVMMLGGRARHALERLGVASVESFLSIGEEDVLGANGCGKGTWIEIGTLQRALGKVGEGHEQVRQGTHASALAGPVMAFDEAITMLGGRARHTLDRLGVTSTESLRSVTQECVLGLKGCGIRTWLEIENLQRTLGLIDEESPSDDRDSVSYEDLLTNQPVTTESLLETPLFSSRAVPAVKPHDLHPTYQADLLVDTLSLPARAYTVCRNLHIADLGALLCTRPMALLAQGNCGERTVAGIQEAVKEELLPQYRHKAGAADLRSFAGMVDFWVTRVSGAGRNSQVLLRRLMAPGASLPTLEQLGSERGLTRERIRQIILVGRRKLCERKSLRVIEGFWRTVDAALTKAGLLMSLDDATRRISSRLGWTAAPSSAQIGRILSLNASYVVDEKRSIVYQSALPCVSCKQVRSMLLELFKDGTQEMHVADAAYRLAVMCLERCRATGGRATHHQPVFVATVLPLCGGRIVLDGEVVMTKAFWQAKKPKTLRQLVSEILHAFGRPAHHGEIGAAIRDRNSRLRDVTAKQVVDCLCRYDSFTYVGRGAYSLAVWGHKAYKNHAEVIIELLESAREPLLRSHIIACLTGDGTYSGRNLRIPLGAQSRIVKIGRDRYDLRERAAASRALLEAGVNGR